ncbi:hypothetical protein WN944_018753 [Citrus x changshan-huyou]|uniref:AP2/ERF domain-containing protein n=1 Tax=Citrus x changshan-huyou TaxID=2935761 RepID=A0AAP0LYN8_9ROSI
MGKWATEIVDPKKGVRVCLGTFDIVEEVARAYAEAAKRNRYNMAKLDFADLLLPITPAPAKKCCMLFPELT